jgi:hypothetical protein
VTPIDRSPGFEANLESGTRLLERFNAPMPEDILEPRSPVQFRCPECGLVQDVAVCECGEPLCARCDPDPRKHVACMMPEEIEDRVRAAHDCILWFMRIRHAARSNGKDACYQIANNALAELEKRGVV